MDRKTYLNFWLLNTESIQKKGCAIIFPTYDYNEDLSALSLSTLNERRESTRLQNENHPLYFILPKLVKVQHYYHVK